MEGDFKARKIFERKVFIFQSCRKISFLVSGYQCYRGRMSGNSGVRTKLYGREQIPIRGGKISIHKLYRLIIFLMIQEIDASSVEIMIEMGQLEGMLLTIFERNTSLIIWQSVDGIKAVKEQKHFSRSDKERGRVVFLLEKELLISLLILLFQHIIQSKIQSFILLIQRILQEFVKGRFHSLQITARL